MFLEPIVSKLHNRKTANTLINQLSQVSAPLRGPPPSSPNRASLTVRLQLPLDKSWWQRHHALQNDKPDVSALMGLYADLSRMRVLSSARVIDSADQIVKKIINAYPEPNKTFSELRQMADSGLIDPLRNFSEACRAESESLHYRPSA
jgi:hypothetical protein